jgi:hypothetical protein
MGLDCDYSHLYARFASPIRALKDHGASSGFITEIVARKVDIRCMEF